MNSRRFITLDGLRGVAAFVVAAGHAGFLHSVSREFYLAVDFFFVLSGFVLAYAYGEQLVKGMSAHRFMLIRLIRLYPLYILGSAIVLLVVVARSLHQPVVLSALAVNAVTAALFLPSPIAAVLFPLNSPAWSLLFELIANYWYGIVCRWLSSPILVVMLGGAAVAIVAYAIRNHALNGGFRWSGFGGGIIRVSYSFFAGVLVHRIWLKHPARISVPPPIMGLFLLALLVCPVPRAYQTGYAAILMLLVFPLVVWVGATSEPKHAASARLCLWLGSTSYAIYILHNPILRITLKWKLVHPVGWAILFVAAVIIAADLTTRYFDVPIRRLLTKWLSPGSIRSENQDG